MCTVGLLLPYMTIPLIYIHVYYRDDSVHHVYYVVLIAE